MRNLRSGLPDRRNVMVSSLSCLVYGIAGHFNVGGDVSGAVSHAVSTTLAVGLSVGVFSGTIVGDCDSALIGAGDGGGITS
mmetsp:Transcript_11260/g.24366  ORF Transcript_11260/g.24366 Transcript_11260/m.24366 type:complete len:81 (+) Transcript_11260:2888-3130(+)